MNNDGRVKGLAYDSTVTGGQSAQFNFSVTVPTGQSVTAMYWYMDTVPVASGSTSYSYKEVGTGKHTVSLRLTTVDQGNVGHVYVGSLTFAAIGGPLMYFAMEGEPSLSRPDHDNANENAPWYLEYFGYVASGTPPAGAQRSRIGGTMVALAQPDGTTHDWHVTGPAVGDGTATTTACTVFPVAGSDPGGIIVFTHNYYAATRSSALGAFGQLVRSCVDTLTLHSVTHD